MDLPVSGRVGRYDASNLLVLLPEYTGYRPAVKAIFVSVILYRSSKNGVERVFSLPTPHILRAAPS